jgi:hypothetical protein
MKMYRKLTLSVWLYYTRAKQAMVGTPFITHVLNKQWLVRPFFAFVFSGRPSELTTTHKFF